MALLSLMNDMITISPRLSKYVRQRREQLHSLENVVRANSLVVSHFGKKGSLMEKTNDQRDVFIREVDHWKRRLGEFRTISRGRVEDSYNSNPRFPQFPSLGHLNLVQKEFGAWSNHNETGLFRSRFIFGNVSLGMFLPFYIRHYTLVSLVYLPIGQILI